MNTSSYPFPGFLKIEDEDEDAKAIIDAARSESDDICGIGGISETEIKVPTGEVDSVFTLSGENSEQSISVFSTDSSLSEVVSEFEDLSDLSEGSEDADYEPQRKLERMASELENLF